MKKVRPAQPPLSRFTATLFVSLISGLVAGAGWCYLLGWDTRKTLGADGYQHGPYEVWQVAVLVVVLGVLAVWLGYRNSLVVGPLTAAIALTALFSAQAAVKPENDGLWPVGAITLFAASFGGLGVTALVSASVLRRNG